jgi:hypothetical protein
MKKTLVISVGAKGGTGKTIAMVGLADWLIARGRAFQAFDCDQENRGKISAFANYFAAGEVGTPDLRDKKACDILLLTASKCETGLMLVDLPANSGSDFLNWVREVCTPENLDELNVRVIMVGVITPEIATFGAVLDWAEVMQGTVSYVIALNHKTETRVDMSAKEIMPEYFSTKTGAKFREFFKPAEIEIPALYNPAMEALRISRGMPSAVAAPGSTVQALDRTRIRSWIAKVHKQWDAAEPTLNLLK